jgi:hypothetical protein
VPVRVTVTSFGCRLPGVPYVFGVPAPGLNELHDCFATCREHREVSIRRARRFIVKYVRLTRAAPGTVCETCGRPAEFEVWA